MDLRTITPLVLTYNEEPNIGRVLDRLEWADRIVVIDSGSTDGTRAILDARSNVDCIQRPFDSFAGQCNFGLGQIETEWVLSLDADYVLSPELVAEMRQVESGEDTAHYSARFRYCIGGSPLRASLYPPRTVLYRRRGASYVDDGHSHEVRVEGRGARFRNVIYHDDRKPLDRWLENQRVYAAREAEKLLSATAGELSLADRVRGVGAGPLAVAAYCLFAKGLLLDGGRGWRYTLERTCAEALVALELFERSSRRVE